MNEYIKLLSLEQLHKTNIIRNGNLFKTKISTTILSFGNIYNI